MLLSGITALQLEEQRRNSQLTLQALFGYLRPVLVESRLAPPKPDDDTESLCVRSVLAHLAVPNSNADCHGLGEC